MTERPKESLVGSTPPPRKEDKLFGADENWQTNACVNYAPRPDWLYSLGYRTAARSLAQQVCTTLRDQDSLVYPIVYLYRHHIELVLKNLIIVSSELLDKQITEQEIKMLGKHGLDQLWAILRPLLNPAVEVGGSEPLPDEDIEGIDSYITQLNEHDPDGQRFRYAKLKSKRGEEAQASLKADLRHINIYAFANYMEMLADYLDSIEGWFGQLLEFKYEAMSECY